MRILKLQIMGGNGMKVFSHFQDLEQLQRAGAWTCEAVDHDSPEGCSNPKCFKFKRLLLVNDELTPPSRKG